MANKKNEKQTFEQAVSRIDEIVSSLETGDAPLDKSLTLFEEGIELIKTCTEMLETAEQTVVRLKNTINNDTTNDDSANDESTKSNADMKEYLFDD